MGFHVRPSSSNFRLWRRIHFHRRSNRPTPVMPCKANLRRKRKLGDLATSSSITGTATGYFGTLLSKNHQWCGGDSSRILPKESLHHREETQQHSMFLSGRQVACMIFDHVRTSDADGQSWISQLFCKLSSGNGSVQSFDTKWDGTIVAVRQQPDEEVLDDSYLSSITKRIS